MIGSKGKYCGERIRITYPQGAQITEFELMVKGEENDCTVKEKVSVLNQPALIKVSIINSTIKKGLCRILIQTV